VESFQIVSEGEEFVTLAEAKRHLVVDHDEDDIFILSLISAARRWCEHRTSRFFTPTSVTLSRNGFSSVMPLRHKPVREIVSIVYDDADTTGVTLDPDYYELDAYNNCVVQAYGKTYPSTRHHWNAVRITYRAGYVDGSPEVVSVPEDVKHAALMVLGDWYENREAQQDKALYSNHAADMLLSNYRVYE
jgi:uncharacterized phiE125 gp8 family phage protein